MPYEIGFSAYIQPARMPTTCEAPQLGEAITMGFGRTNTELKFAVLRIFPQYFCDMYRGFKWDSSVICAFNSKTKQSTQSGNSGGPLLFDETLIGVLSFGPSGKHFFKSFDFS